VLTFIVIMSVALVVQVASSVERKDTYLVIVQVLVLNHKVETMILPFDGIGSYSRCIFYFQLLRSKRNRSV